MPALPPRPSPLAMLALAVLWAIPALAPAQEQPFRPGESRPRQDTPPKKKLKEEGRNLFGPGRGDASPGAGAWSIVLGAFREDDPGAKAALQRVQREAGLADAYLEHRGPAMVIAYGRYDDASSKAAQADLERIKALEVPVNGQPTRPFASAFLAPPAEIAGTIPEYDLRNVRKLQGDWALYTLQIGVYSREDGVPASAAEMAEFRKAAERAVVQLRREGEQAFYYHGPRRSMVTVGLFGKDDFDPQTPGLESPTLRVLRQRYPYNLNNGLGIRQTLKVTDPRTGTQVRKEKLQPSGLMNVPKK